MNNLNLDGIVLGVLRVTFEVLNQLEYHAHEHDPSDWDKTCKRRVGAYGRDAL